MSTYGAVDSNGRTGAVAACFRNDTISPELFIKLKNVIYLNFVNDGHESWTFEAHGADKIRRVIKVADVFRVHFEKRSETRHDVAYASFLLLLLFPFPQALLQFGQEEIVMQFKKRFDVGEHLRNQILGKHSVGPVLLVNPELENLHDKTTNEYSIQFDRP